MTEKGAEGLVQEVKTYLTTNFATHLASVQSRFTPTLELENVTEWRIDDPMNGKLPDKLPLGWVVAPISAIDQWGQDYAYVKAAIVIWVLIRDSDAERLRSRIYRTMQAVWECVRAGHFDSGISFNIVEDDPSLDYSEILTGPRGVLLSDARLRLRMYGFEQAS